MWTGVKLSMHKGFVWLVFVLGFFSFMLALSWNVRGLGRREKRRMVKNLVLKHKPMLLFL